MVGVARTQMWVLTWTCKARCRRSQVHESGTETVWEMKGADGQG